MQFHLWIVSTIFLLLNVHFGLAAPNPEPALEKRVPCDELKKYTEDFLKSVACRKQRPCLFYTFDLSSKAQKYAAASKDPNLRSLWQTYKKEFVSKDTSENNKLRCIMGNEKDMREYFKRMSIALAKTCPKNKAYLLTPDINNIPQNGYWGKYEFPALKEDRGDAGKRVDQIIAISSEDNSKTKVIWERDSAIGSNSRKRDISVNMTLFAREDEPEGCDDDKNFLTEEEVGTNYDDIDW